MANKTKYTEILFDQICQELAEGQSIHIVNRLSTHLNTLF